MLNLAIVNDPIFLPFLTFYKSIEHNAVDLLFDWLNTFPIQSNQTYIFFTFIAIHIHIAYFITV